MSKLWHKCAAAVRTRHCIQQYGTQQCYSYQHDCSTQLSGAWIHLFQRRLLPRYGQDIQNSAKPAVPMLKETCCASTKHTHTLQTLRMFMRLLTCTPYAIPDNFRKGNYYMYKAHKAQLCNASKSTLYCSAPKPLTVPKCLLLIPPYPQKICSFPNHKPMLHLL